MMDEDDNITVVLCPSPRPSPNADNAHFVILNEVRTGN